MEPPRGGLGATTPPSPAQHGIHLIATAAGGATPTTFLVDTTRGGSITADHAGFTEDGTTCGSGATMYDAGNHSHPIITSDTLSGHMLDNHGIAHATTTKWLYIPGLRSVIAADMIAGSGTDVHLCHDTHITDGFIVAPLDREGGRYAVDTHIGSTGT